MNKTMLIIVMSVFIYVAFRLLWIYFSSYDWRILGSKEKSRDREIR
jgi:hypothetical protein